MKLLKWSLLIGAAVIAPLAGFIAILRWFCDLLEDAEDIAFS